VQDLAAVVALARHVAAAPLAISRSTAAGIESVGISQAAEHLTELPPAVLDDLSARLDGLPAMPGLADVVRGEEKIGMAAPANSPGAAMIGQMGPFYASLARAIALPPAEFEEGWAEMQKEAQRAGAFAGILLPAMRKVREADDRLVAQRAMLKAAVVVQRRGTDAPPDIKDPFGEGPFEHRKLPGGGYELQSKLMFRDKPVKLTVGGKER
jgi:hypothetical protein